MMPSRSFAAFAALAATLLAQEAFAQFTVSIEPANPTPADTVFLVVTSPGPGCPTFAPDGVRFQGDTIRVAIFPAAGPCPTPPHPVRALLGRLPLGSYTVVWSANLDDTKAFTVSLPPGTGTPAAAAPFENYTGLWITGVAGEGVSITQSGKTVFLSYQTYGPDGFPLWVVMSDAKWEYDANRAVFRFRGTVYITRRLSAVALAVAPVGEASLYPSNRDTALLEMNVDGLAATRLLTRFFF